MNKEEVSKIYEIINRLDKIQSFNKSMELLNITDELEDLVTTKTPPILRLTPKMLTNHIK